MSKKLPDLPHPAASFEVVVLPPSHTACAPKPRGLGLRSGKKQECRNYPVGPNTQRAPLGSVAQILFWCENVEWSRVQGETKGGVHHCPSIC